MEYEMRIIAFDLKISYRWLVWLRIVVSHEKYKIESGRVILKSSPDFHLSLL